MRVHFDGWILRVGTSSGNRVVAVTGRGRRSGRSDGMIDRRDGRRLLLAPHLAVGDFIATRYTFDQFTLLPVTAGRPDPVTWTVTAGPRNLPAGTGRRPPLGWLGRRRFRYGRGRS